MNKDKVFVHTSYVGNSGYNSHAQNFFRELSKYKDIKIRNFTVGPTWTGLGEKPHGKESMLTEKDHSMLAIQTCMDESGRSDHQINNNVVDSYDVNIVLNETNHYYFYDDYLGPKIAYNVWESTRYPQEFFNRLLEFDELWVPSNWQKECAIEQGYPEEKIQVVPEGVDVDTFKPRTLKITKPEKFTFFLAGRWDYRKSTKEIIETFINTFKDISDVELIVSIDNAWAGDVDGYKTTEDRLEGWGLLDDKIKIVHFPERSEYVNLIKDSSCFLSCARAEGWNLPLIEAMAAGTPSIYSECSGQLEFAEGKGIPVKIKGTIPTNNNSYSSFASGDFPGEFYEPDFKHLGKVMLDVYHNYKQYKETAIEESFEIRKEFSWERVAKIGNNKLDNFLNKRRGVDNNNIYVSFNNGPKVEILGNDSKRYKVDFVDRNTKEVIHTGTISNNMWIKCSREWYTDWDIVINDKLEHSFDLRDKVVIIRLDSKSVGDTLAWIPYVLEFKKKHRCKLYLSTFHNEWFECHGDYRDISFIKPGDDIDSYATFTIGWFKENGQWDGKFKSPYKPNTIPLQKSSSSILGLEHKEIRPKLCFKKKPISKTKPYVAISTRSTAALKEWDPKKWESVISYLNQMGYDVIEVSNEKCHLKGVINLEDTSWESTFNTINDADFFIGLSSGLSWVAWSLGKKVILISNFSAPDHEFTSNTYRIYNHSVCNSCWNNPNFVFDAGDWNWCPINKGLKKERICHKIITPKDVYQVLHQVINDLS